MQVLSDQTWCAGTVIPNATVTVSEYMYIYLVFDKDNDALNDLATNLLQQSVNMEPDTQKHPRRLTSCCARKSVFLYFKVKDVA